MAAISGYLAVGLVGHGGNWLTRETLLCHVRADNGGIYLWISSRPAQPESTVVASIVSTAEAAENWAYPGILLQEAR